MPMLSSALAVSLASLALPSAPHATYAACPDKIFTDVGIGGGGTVTALANVSTQAECCALCHGNYHDECSGWVYGPTGSPDLAGLSLAKHNCAIMATNGPHKPVLGHVTGINANAPPPPPPAPSGKPCNADIDCQPASGALWRCKQSNKAGPSSAANNCHVPGPGTAGNNTCACSTQGCSPGKSTPSTPTKKQYLVIGDSISLGMNSDLTSLVAARGWELTHNPGNAASSNLGAHCVPSWVQAASRAYDIISFQFGLHDLGFDTERISVQQYTALMTNITDYLVDIAQKHGTKLLWVKTTPVPTVPTYGPACNVTSKCLNPPRFDSDVVVYNAAADGVMAAANARGANISTADLYSFVLRKCGGKGYAHCDGFQLPMNVHYTASGWTSLAAEMDRILQAL